MCACIWGGSCIASYSGIGYEAKGLCVCLCVGGGGGGGVGEEESLTNCYHGDR